VPVAELSRRQDADAVARRRVEGQVADTEDQMAHFLARVERRDAARLGEDGGPDPGGGRRGGLG